MFPARRFRNCDLMFIGMFGPRSSVPERTSVGQRKWSVTPKYHPTFSQILLDEQSSAEDSPDSMLTVPHEAQRWLTLSFSHVVLHSIPTPRQGGGVMGKCRCCCRAYF